MASILVPSQGAVMLWDAVRGTAIGLSIALAESFQRLMAHKRPSLLETILPADIDAEIEVSFEKGVPTVTSTKKPAAQKPKKVKVRSVA